MLDITWTGEGGLEHFSLVCRSDSTQHQWKRAIDSATITAKDQVGIHSKAPAPPISPFDPSDNLHHSSNSEKLKHRQFVDSGLAGFERTRTPAQPNHDSSAPASNLSTIYVTIRLEMKGSTQSHAVIVHSGIKYIELVDKVLTEVRNDPNVGLNASNIRLRFEDEEGDKISISSDEDVSLAMASATPGIKSGVPSLTVFVQ